MNKTVLITGANGGIGRELVKIFASNGYKIYANLRTEKEDFLIFAEQMKVAYNIDIECIYFDLTSEEQIKNAILKLRKENKKIDVLINNAGVAHGGLTQMTPIEDIKKVFDVNFFSAVILTQYVSRMMSRTGGGSIVNIASVSGIELAAGNCAYGTSKAALIAFTKCVSKELASQNIRVNAVAPGLTDTNMAKLMEKNAGEAMVRSTSFNRLATPEEIAKGVYFLASEDASFVTGQVLRIDGGM